MNKKGYLMSSVFGIVGLFILLLACVALVPVQEGSAEVSDAMRVLNGTQGSLAEQFKINKSDHVAIRVTYSFIGFLTYSAIEVTKYAVEYGAANPNIVNPITLLWIITLSFIAPLILVLFKLAIIIFLLIKEVLQSRKEKKNYKR